MSITADEIATQPRLWPLAAALAVERDRASFPRAGRGVCVVGCGTSLYIAQAWAAPARGAPATGRPTRSPRPSCRAGRALRRRSSRSRARARPPRSSTRCARLRRASAAWRIIADRRHAGRRRRRRRVVLDFADEASVVQTRFATTALTLLRERVEPGAAATAAADAERALAAAAAGRPGDVEQWTFLGRGWTVGLAARGRAQAARERAGLDRGLPGCSSTATARSASRRPAGRLVARRRSTAGRRESSRATGATVVADGARSARRRSCSPSARRSRSPTAAGLDPDQPRNLTRSVILADPSSEVTA